jgi:hypothetical protein
LFSRLGHPECLLFRSLTILDTPHGYSCFRRRVVDIEFVVFVLRYLIFVVVLDGFLDGVWRLIRLQGCIM